MHDTNPQHVLKNPINFFCISIYIWIIICIQGQIYPQTYEKLFLFVVFCKDFLLLFVMAQNWDLLPHFCSILGFDRKMLVA